MNTSDVIVVMFRDMIQRFSQTVRKKINPHRYHDFAPVKEANTIHFFCEAVEEQLGGLSFLEFSNDTTRVDAILVTPQTLFLVEAKGTLMRHDISGKLKRLDQQASVFENGSHSFTNYLRTEIINQFQHNIQWGGPYSFQEIWGILLSDTFHDDLRLRWDNASSRDYATLATYTRSSELNPSYSDERDH